MWDASEEAVVVASVANGVSEASGASDLDRL